MILFADGHTASTIFFRWEDPGMTFKDGIVHSQFKIGTPSSYICDREYPSGIYYIPDFCLCT